LILFAVFANGQNTAIKAADSTGDEKLPNGGHSCTSDDDCGDFRGYCDNKTAKCICYEKYTDSKCNYARKSQLTAFLLSLLISGVGAGRFYLGLTLSAVFQLLIGLCTIIIPIVAGCTIFCQKGKITGIFIFLSFLFGLASFGWWLADSILTGTNQLQDGEGVYPYSW